MGGGRGTREGRGGPLDEVVIDAAEEPEEDAHARGSRTATVGGAGKAAVNCAPGGP